MLGTRKQVDWAYSIQREIIRILRVLRKEYIGLNEDINKGINEIMNAEDAGWLINNFKWVLASKNEEYKKEYFIEWVKEIKKLEEKEKNYWSELEFGKELLRYLDFEYIY